MSRLWTRSVAVYRSNSLPIVLVSSSSCCRSCLRHRLLVARLGLFFMLGRVWILADLFRAVSLCDSQASWSTVCMTTVMHTSHLYAPPCIYHNSTRTRSVHPRILPVCTKLKSRAETATAPAATPPNPTAPPTVRRATAKPPPTPRETTPPLPPPAAVTPRPPARSQLDAIPVKIRKNRASRQAETAQSPCPFGRSWSSFLAIIRQKAKRPRREKPCVRISVVLLGPGCT